MTKNSLRGYTLFELLVVIAMVAILSTIAYPVFIGVQERGKALKDMNNLRQIGVATQLYLNDNDGVFFPPAPAPSWMMQLYPKYLPSWDVFQSPLDTRAPSDLGDATTPISYGINQNVAGTGLLANKIVTPSAFILFAPAQDSNPATVEFQGTAATAAPGVTVVGIGGSPPPPAPPLPAKATSIPGGDAIGGTHSSRNQINAVFSDWHAENMPWTTFTSDTADAGTTCSNGSTPTVSYRWHPDPCNP